MNNLWYALGLTLFAGMATGIGSIIAFTASHSNYRFLSISTGFSAGVMLYVSFVEIFFHGGESLALIYGDKWGAWINAAAFFGGILLIGLVDYLIPEAENPHEVRSERKVALLHDPNKKPCDEQDAPQPAAAAANTAPNLMRMGLFTALAIAIHNFPEGLATFMSALENPGLGMAIAVAIALHNIPEGISVSVPIYYATGNRRKAFVYSFLSGLAEPLGAVVAFLAIRLIAGSENGVFPPQLMGILLSGVAGIMVYISIDELLPASRAYGKGHDSIIGLISGMAVMAVSLLMMR
ncbi:zinc transporter ZupT [bacterium]|nr:zinc transporter ZupT [bacterium]